MLPYKSFFTQPLLWRSVLVFPFLMAIVPRLHDCKRCIRSLFYLQKQ
ncbi:hypothetical protein HMPREF3213_02671 [Heyndrickxia coagulans]|uniref:Uncharacterized protein n=1 Tax=Heyndrickxia coagulans TaxID=1398 RepID=A0A133KJ27_HEYCO|nr:hypothetical protein HMPREF3213_02671 [Heyndrickxia coagulans]